MFKENLPDYLTFAVQDYTMKLEIKVKDANLDSYFSLHSNKISSLKLSNEEDLIDLKLYVYTCQDINCDTCKFSSSDNQTTCEVCKSGFALENGVCKDKT